MATRNITIINKYIRLAFAVNNDDCLIIDEFDEECCS